MMSCKVETYQSGRKVKALRATVPVFPGEELYVAEPFVYAVKEDVRGRRCEFCLMSKDRLLRCSQCKYAKYCSKPCQVKAWLDHKRECKCLDSVFMSDNVDTFRLAMRVIFKMIRNSPCPSESLCSMSELECRPKLRNRGFENTAKKLLVHMKKEIAHPSELPSKLNLPALIAIVQVYRLFILNGKLSQAGVGVYPSMCLLNHCCEPNCTIVYMGHLAHLRAIRKIEAGEELTVAIGTPKTTTEERQSTLRLLYGYECVCRRCQTRYMDESMLAGDEQALDETRVVIRVVKDLEAKAQWVDALEVLRAQLQRNAGRVPDKNIYQLDVLYCALTACVALRLTKEGLLYGYRALESCSFYTSGINWERAEIMGKIAALECLGGNKSTAYKIIKEAADIYELFLGRSHPLSKKLMEKIKVWSVTLI